MAKRKSIDKRQLLKKIIESANISQEQAVAVLSCLFDAESIFTTGGINEVQTAKEKVVELKTPGALQSVELVREKPVITKET